ncbi:MAG: LysR family transcriptional regulator, partial [Pseudomonadota bacterium]
MRHAFALANYHLLGIGPVPKLDKFTPKASAVTAISDLDIFARVARTGNMSAAGREMGLSPAVVSKRISML